MILQIQLGQTLDVDKGRVLQSRQWSLDLLILITRSPNLLLLGFDRRHSGAKAQVFMGFEGVPFSEYNLIFRGNVDDIKSAPSLVKINLAHPDNKRGN